jgi:hypothetical protein
MVAKAHWLLATTTPNVPKHTLNIATVESISTTTTITTTTMSIITTKRTITIMPTINVHFHIWLGIFSS